jgi:hypothetical protein
VWRPSSEVVASIAIVAAVVGVFCTWTKAGGVTLNGTQGPHDGWLVVIVAAPALLWSRSMARGSWVGVVGVLGTAVVIGWTAVDSWRGSRDVLGATAGYGLVLVLASSVALAAAAVVCAVGLRRRREEPAPIRP